MSAVDTGKIIKTTKLKAVSEADFRGAIESSDRFFAQSGEQEVAEDGFCVNYFNYDDVFLGSIIIADGEVEYLLEDEDDD